MLARRLTAVILLVVCAILPGLGSANAADPAAGFKQGINVRNYLAYPDFETWPYYRGDLANPTDEELHRLRRLGFDFIRLTVEAGPWVTAPADVRRALAARLTDFIRRADAASLRTIVNIFPRPDAGNWRPEDILASRDGPALLAYRALLMEIARVLDGERTSAPALELMNEPQAECRNAGTPGSGTPDWADVQPALFADVRSVAPSLTVVLTGGCWSRIAGLAHIDMTAFDDNTLIDVHYYDPFPFTHQGAWWTVPELHHAAGLAFPPSATDMAIVEKAVGRMLDARHKGSASERRRIARQTLRTVRQYIRDDFGEAAIASEMDQLAAWAARNNVAPHRILIGEFGVLRIWPESGLRDDGSRARWLGTVRRAATARGFAWALWSYEGVFGLMDDEAAKTLDPVMIEALGLTP